MRPVIMFAAAFVLIGFLAGAASAQEIVQLKSTRTPAEREAAFTAADANKDGKLDLAEFKKAIEPQILAQLGEAVGQMKDQRDTDADGFVSKAEFLAPGRIQIHP
jgi:hypothetical protein